MIEEIEFKEFKKLENALLIDVREVSERNEKHIGGIHIPLAELENNLDLIDPNRPIVLYCKKGGRSLRAAQLLAKHFPKTKFYSIRGGIEKTFVT